MPFDIKTVFSSQTPVSRKSIKMIQPRFLKKGDKVAITCPAKSLPGSIDTAIALLRSWGLEVICGETVFARHNQFAGDDDLRRRDMQRFLDDESLSAIIAARGGYGTIRIIDQLDFSLFKKNPKWLAGFSDITVLHSHINRQHEIETIHGQMPLNVPDATKASLESLRKSLFGEPLSYTFPSNIMNIGGECEGILIGGNLTLLMMMQGSSSEMDFTDKILFIEDVGEYYYSIDRMLRAMDRAGKLSALKGLVVGGFSGMKDNETPFGETIEDIVLSVAGKYAYPICFDFPAGHIDNNFALRLGGKARLRIMEEDQCYFRQ